MKGERDEAAGGRGERTRKRTEHKECEDQSLAKRKIKRRKQRKWKEGKSRSNTKGEMGETAALQQAREGRQEGAGRGEGNSSHTWHVSLLLERMSLLFFFSRNA